MHQGLAAHAEEGPVASAHDVLNDTERECQPCWRGRGAWWSVEQ